VLFLCFIIGVDNIFCSARAFLYLFEMLMVTLGTHRDCSLPSADLTASLVYSLVHSLLPSSFVSRLFLPLLIYCLGCILGLFHSTNCSLSSVCVYNVGVFMILYE